MSAPQATALCAMIAGWVSFKVYLHRTWQAAVLVTEEGRHACEHGQQR